MIQKKSWLNVSDNTNVNWLQTFHLYKGFKRRSSSIGFFIKASARIVEPPRVEYKGFKFKFNKKGNICRGLLVRTAYTNSRLDGATVSFYENSTILIKKKQNPKSKYILGPTLYNLKRKKFKSLFKLVV